MTKTHLPVQVSIIVPVYNAGKYLESCLNSLQSQTLKEIEILCINDGSADNSETILDIYSRNDSRIKVITTANRGPAAARNTGLDNASGAYIMFCDADDSYCPSMCEEMLAVLGDKNVDIVMCDTNLYNRQGKITHNAYYFPFQSGRHTLKQDMKAGLNVYLWNKIFRKSKIDLFGIRFPEGHKSDDNLFVYQYVACSESVYFLNQRLYNHFDRENSIMDLYHSAGIKFQDILDKMDIMEIFYVFLKRNALFGSNKEMFSQLFWNELFYAWINVPNQWAENFLSRCSEVLARIDDKSWRTEDIKNFLYEKIENHNFFEASQALDMLVVQNKRTRRRYVVQEEIFPAFLKNDIPVVFNFDDAYCKYFSVVLQSILAYADKAENYDLIVLNDDISLKNQEKLLVQIAPYPNVSLRFYNMEAYKEKYQIGKWFIKPHMKPAVYYRLFIAEVCKNFDRVVYLDSDLILNTDIAKLYALSLHGKSCAAVRDTFVSHLSPGNELCFPGFCSYARNILKISDLSSYFNSGVMLLDIKKMRKGQFLEIFLETAKKNHNFFHDQNVLNSAFYNDVFLLENCWNTQINSGSVLDLLQIKKLSDIKIIHFCSKNKPWKDSRGMFAYLWWQHALGSPFYDEIVTEKISEEVNRKLALQIQFFKFPKSILFYRKYKLRYWRTKILSFLFWGPKRLKYQQKMMLLKKELKEAKAFFKGREACI